MHSHTIQAALTIDSSNLCYNILEKIASHNTFTTVLEASKNAILPVALSLLSVDPFSSGDEINITHIAILRKGNRVATGQIRIKADEILELPPHSIKSILNLLPIKYQTIGRRYFNGGYSKIPEKTGQALFKAILECFPSQAKEIQHFSSRANRSVIIQNYRAQDAAAEKDAVGLSLDIFGIDRSKILRSWENHSMGESWGQSFLNGLSQYSAYEDDLINHDLRNLPGWSTISNNITGIVEFENNDKERLIIINANRKPLEKALGIDLIYFHRKYEAFTLVQYKMMDQKVENGNECYYNPNQKSQLEEQKRMEKLYSILLEDKSSDSLIDYRLGNCPIFFKICKKLQLKYDDATIAPGAYIPLNQWKILLDDDSTKGPKGGCQIGFHTLGKRYIGTAVFVDLVQRGFLGTQSAASKKLGLFIQTAIADGHSIVYAIDNKDTLKEKEHRRTYV